MLNNNMMGKVFIIFAGILLGLNLASAVNVGIGDDEIGIDLIPSASALVNAEHDSLSGRNNILINHPNIIDVFYTKAQVENNLSLFVPYIGATADLNLGIHDIYVNNVASEFLYGNATLVVHDKSKFWYNQTQDLTNYVPYTLATDDLNLGSHDIYVNNVASNFLHGNATESTHDKSKFWYNMTSAVVDNLQNNITKGFSAINLTGDSIFKNTNNSLVTIQGGVGSKGGAYFKLTGTDYTLGSPGQGSAEFVIHNINDASDQRDSKFGIFAYDRASTWYTRMTLIGYNGYLGLGTQTPVDMLHLVNGNLRFAQNNYGIKFGNGKANMTYDGTNIRLDYGDTTNDVFRISANISALGYITRTSVYDDSKGSALDYIKTSEDYKTSGEINHSKFYGYTTYDVKDENNCWNVSIIDTSAIDLDNPTRKIFTNITECGTKTEEAVSLNAEVDVLRQAIYELKTQNQELLHRIELLEARADA